MLKIGITGNMGSGKSLVCSIFAKLGIPVFNADQQTKLLYSENDIRLKIQKQYGKSIYHANGKLNKIKLAKLIFNNPFAMQFIRELMYPRLYKRFEEWATEQQKQQFPYVLYEAALIFENDFQSHFDFTILITAPEAIRVERIKERDKFTVSEIRQRMDHQWPETKKLELADFVIQNDGKTMLIPQVLEVHKKLLV
ncbi:MAG: dephospho-CoA kinase [Bacteroidales bacterium]|jgi:dephospho-CoA kinase|nr:dephospho-CoA kinase [Bacteroidales bacterium]